LEEFYISDEKGVHQVFGREAPLRKFFLNASDNRMRLPNVFSGFSVWLKDLVKLGIKGLLGFTHVYFQEDPWNRLTVEESLDLYNIRDINPFGLRTKKL